MYNCQVRHFGAAVTQQINRRRTQTGPHLPAVTELNEFLATWALSILEKRGKVKSMHVRIPTIVQRMKQFSLVSLNSVHISFGDPQCCLIGAFSGSPLALSWRMGAGCRSLW